MKSKSTKNKRKLFIFALIFFFFSPFLFSAFYFYNNRLFLFEAEMLWNSTQLNKLEFRDGNPQKRATMAADIIQSEQFIGKSCSAIPLELGTSTGDYYISDVNTTYKLTENTSANWILTFVCGDHQEIEKVFIRKSCCSTSQTMLFWIIEIMEPLVRLL